MSKLSSRLRALLRPLLYCAIGSVLTACGPCGEVKHVDLTMLSQVHIAADTALFKRHWVLNGRHSLDVQLADLVKHRDAANVFIELGYAQLHGTRLDLTAKGRAISQDNGFSHRLFFIDTQQRQRPVKFTSETEEVQCNEGHSLERTYGFDDRVGPLTPLGQTLLRRGLLYRGSNEPFTKYYPVRWRGPRDPIREKFFFVPGAPAEQSVHFDGESVTFLWKF